MSIRCSRPNSWSLIALAFTAGVLTTLATQTPSTSAQASALPDMFMPGAKLVGPMGPVKVMEVHGEWIVVESGLPGVEGDQWVYVPANGGSWSIDKVAQRLQVE